MQAENRLLARLQKLFGDVMGGVIAEMIERGIVSNDPATVAALVESLRELAEPFGETLTEEMLVAAQHGQAQVVAESGIAIAFDELSETTAQRIREQAFEASQATLDRMVGDVMGNLAESYEEGVGVQEAARNLRAEFDGMLDHELRRVARTELVGAQNVAAFETEQALGIEYHQWYSARDSRVRDSHEDIHGEITRVGDNFSNGLRYPGDRRGRIEEWINCRCRPIVFLMPEGMIAPPGRDQFYENDLVAIA